MEIMPTTSKERKNTEVLFYGIALAFAVILYNFIWLNKTFTMSEGWSKVYIELITSGKLPYKDFYYFLPPLNLLVDFVFWKFSFGYFFVFRLWRLAERVLITELAYNLVNKRVAPFFSAIVCFLGTIMASGNVYDLVGDFNQTVQLLILLLVYCILKYFKTEDEKKKIKYLFWAGIVGGCMFATKQTVTVACGIIFGFLFILLAILKRENKIFRVVFWVGLGAVIPIALLGGYLLLTDTLSEFIYYVFQNTGSKGSLFDILIKSQIGMITSRIAVFIAILLLFIAKAIKMDLLVVNKYKNKLIIACYSVSLLLFGAHYGNTIWNAVVTEVTSGNFIILIIGVCMILWANPKELKGKFVFCVSIVVTAFFLILNINGMTEKLYPNAIFDCVMETVCLIHISLFCQLFFEIISVLASKKDFDVAKWVIICGALASGYTTSMATGVSSVSSITAFISIPTLLIIGSDEINYKSAKDYQSLVRGIECLILIIFTVCMSQKLVGAYNWWGYSDASYWDKDYDSSIKELAGFKFSEEELRKYDDLTEIIEKNSNKDSVIFSFPYAKVYNIFLDNYNMDGFAPVLFYDVCADDVAEKEAKILYEKNPDIVVWLDIPNCMEVHEALFRGGEQLGQRKIQKWFSKVKDSNYDLIGQVDNVFIYKLKDGTAPEYTFIERKTKINETSIYEEDELLKCTLEGQGTFYSPYIVSSAKDLVHFRDLVNSGKSFAGEYVLQTADINLDHLESWEPIGVFSSNKLFEGIYNGNGYNINRLYIENTNEHVGLFGQLAGTVINLSLNDCDIAGDCVGGITSHGINTAMIVNCSVTGKIKGSARAAGIADNMGGKIINCISKVDLSGEICAGISGYYSNTVINCYSNVGNIVSIDDGKPLTKDSINKLNSYLKEIKETDNKLQLNSWKIEGENIKLTHKN